MNKNSRDLVNLTDISRGFPHALQANAEIIPYNNSWPLLSTFLSIHQWKIFLWFDAT